MSNREDFIGVRNEKMRNGWREWDFKCSICGGLLSIIGYFLTKGNITKIITSCRKCGKVTEYEV